MYISYSRRGFFTAVPLLTPHMQPYILLLLIIIYTGISEQTLMSEHLDSGIFLYLLF